MCHIIQASQACLLFPQRLLFSLYNPNGILARWEGILSLPRLFVFPKLLKTVSCYVPPEGMVFWVTGRLSDMRVLWATDPTLLQRVRDPHGSRAPGWGEWSDLTIAFHPLWFWPLSPLTFFCTASASRLQHRLCSCACFLLRPSYSLSHLPSLAGSKSSSQLQ